MLQKESTRQELNGVQTYNFENFSRDLSAWLRNRLLKPILYVEGGWEYWVQIDFPAWIDIRDNVQYDFRREVSGILPNGRLDWLVNQNSSSPTAIEIKAQTHKYPNSKFVTDVMNDVAKLSTLPSTYQKGVLAAVIDAGAYNSLIQKGFKELFTLDTEVAFLLYT